MRGAKAGCCGVAMATCTVSRFRSTKAKAATLVRRCTTKVYWVSPLNVSGLGQRKFSGVAAAKFRGVMTAKVSWD